MLKVACQGCAGAFSHLAAKAAFPEASFVFFPTFEVVLNALKQGIADRAVLPVENSEAGRVADCHILLPASGVFIVAERFLRIEHHLLGVKGAKIQDIKTVRSHVQALSQCANTLSKMGIASYPAANTAMAAKETAQNNDKSFGAVASQTAAELYGLDVLKRNIEDSPNNTTRFLILSAQAQIPPANTDGVITSFVSETFPPHCINLWEALRRTASIFCGWKAMLIRCILFLRAFSSTLRGIPNLWLLKGR